MAGYNRTRYIEELLEKTESLPPSFTVHLYLEYWTLNNGSKFLYNNQIASLLDDVRAHRIPVDFLDLFDIHKVPFYDGCMIVELLDYRPQRNKDPTLEKPERTRTVLHPNSETLWADICSLNTRYGSKWTDRDALDMEARILLATSPPLCLDPDPHLTRIANYVMRVSTPTIPVSLKRKAAVLDPEEDETDKARRAKIMSFMDPRQNRTINPSYRILDAIKRQKEKQQNTSEQKSASPNVFATNTAPSPTKPPTPSITISQAQSPAEADDKKTSKSSASTLMPANGSSPPAPQTAAHPIVTQHLPSLSPTNAQSPLQPQVYPSVQAATEAARRTPTPARNGNYAMSPRPPTSQTPAPTQPQQNINVPQNNTFPPQVKNTYFLNQPPLRPGTSKVTAVPNSAAANQSAPQQQPPLPPVITQAQLLYAQQVQQQQANANALLQQRLNAQRTGRATPQIQGGQAAPSPTAARSSPLAASKPLAARSPMPLTAQLPQQQQPTPQQHPIQHPQHTFTPPYNPAHLRTMVHANTQLPAHLAAAASAAAVNGQTQLAPASSPADNAQPQQTQQGQQQGQPQQQSQQGPLRMYTPPMYQYNYGQIQPRLYWNQQGMGRGMPMVNGQPPVMPGVAHAHAQQVAAKAAPSSIQGR